ncbi:3-oxoacyl-[acyl-carrier-protein] reductase [Geobacter sulfurreducens]|uniref:3-oxoacyl-[acyl-carrier-protein] reductase n=1 Tax=Geobacter sulfurreducens (strain ATCC 51573 / DSM 12127 / PCA) TaxID=243231 RepID=Q74CR9_GEOSL|nr:3-oxoacyl-[acyl-carrier-protein] reductase [Geobacter sulfurreducens]AAR34977.1 3-oxoacyl-(acyl carrier protein) reductase [Geobacter sulfurreducens PCA]ADI84437.1 3-oxoacyl-(acyl carrier protein) reductase [Geobacter sulfurreducens KN400]AJY71516.1 3-oxoacyl-ACP synthase [Geobacter sulfurreducens]QVW36767.1 3-oxoacyl-[acyl-carrier-protein] reductase [Geobacter sulfurreducens]UAC05604.1 3-oxoacyl-[acyl-carrier-protein] reductase [Geobacter sulfurreducens]
MSLAGKIAVVTGASRGIGREIALRLAREGADVAVTATTLDSARKTADEIEQIGRRALALAVDVADAAAVEALFASVVEAFGKVDILVNNAGITRDGLLLRMKDADWDAVLDVNLKGAFNCTREAAKLMTKARSGRIVNIGSVVGEMGNAGQVNYCASKAGMIGMTKAVARELAKRGITVNAVTPGFIETDMTAVLSEKVRESLMQQIPLERFGSPEDIANAVHFLVSDMGSYITGHVLSVNGGMYM